MKCVNITINFLIKFIKKLMLPMNEELIHGTILAKKVRNGYSVYVFQTDSGEYRMGTVRPNWGADFNFSIGDSGFVTLETAIAGEPYYNRKKECQDIYQFSNVYINEFVKDKEINKIIL